MNCLFYVTTKFQQCKEITNIYVYTQTLYLCAWSEECTQQMGMMTGQIRDSMLSASSSRDSAHGPQRARLGGSGVWMPAIDDSHQYIQVDLLTERYVTGVTTQGRAAVPTFVKTYRVLYSVDDVTWNMYREEREKDKVGHNSCL